MPRNLNSFDQTPITLTNDDLKLSSGNKTITDPSPPITEFQEKITQIHGLEKEEDGAPKESLETNLSEKSDDIVLRKLLRGLRYFDPPDDSQGNCYNCGEGGHIVADCTSAKPKKPCFVCGSLEHHVKQCDKGKDCSICKKGGHFAKDCPEESDSGSQSANICLNCGDLGHDMFSCNKSEYSLDDLKEIQCYVCKCFGHLCCSNYVSEGSREVSCYRCGQLGHSGLECARVHAKTNTRWTPSSCYMCGQEAHTACKCTAAIQSPKREIGSPSSRKKKRLRRKRSKKKPSSSKSKTRGRGKQPSSSQPKPRGRGGWIAEGPHAYNNNHGWGSLNTQATYINNDPYHGVNAYQPSSVIFHGGNGYQSFNDQFHGGYDYQPYNVRFHGGNGYQPSVDRFPGGNGINL